ncbi:hypothetical protein GP486_004991 [Trichoglossum hirsutum]|uniref:Uncharacterized protein n=1 Tax=Trichoglossum hirsutum TaxID=265104 RepID=A0A9P8LA18_9PEZI|nr:hypothetical protein GP486_004991 [Trichoglossum hirsutum]
MKNIAATPTADCEKKRRVRDPASATRSPTPMSLNMPKEDSSEPGDLPPSKRVRRTAPIDLTGTYPSRLTSQNSSGSGDSIFVEGPDVSKGGPPPSPHEPDSAPF